MPHIQQEGALANPLCHCIFLASSRTESVEDFLTLRAGSVPSSFKEVRNTSEEGKDQSLRLQAAALVLGIIRLIIEIIRLF